VSPFEPLTPAELYLMARAKQSEAWNHTSMVLAMLFNANCGKGQQKTAEDFHPFIKKKKASGMRLKDLRKILGR
jgi:hypothetical protein